MSSSFAVYPPFVIEPRTLDRQRERLYLDNMEDKGSEYPSQAPPELRLAMVAIQHLEKKNKAIEKTGELNDKLGDINKKVEEATQKVSDTEISSNNERAKLGGLGRFFGENTRKSKVAKVTDESAKVAQERAGVMNETVKTLETYARESELVSANLKSGPTETSSKMTEALKQQGVVKAYTEFGYPIENADNLPTKETFDNIRTIVYELKFARGIEQQEESVKNSEEYLEQNPSDPRNRKGLEDRKITLERMKKEAEMKSVECVLDMTPFIEVATEICDKENISLSEKLIEIAIKEGMQITQGVEGKYLRGAIDFARDKRGGPVSAGDVAYYAIGAFQLNSFFEHRKNISGRNRLPYVIAYTAGALTNGSPTGLSHHLRNWLSETIPGAVIDSVRENGKWTIKQTASEARGYGYFLKPENERKQFSEGQTYEQGWVDIVTEANGISTRVYDKLGEKRRFNAQRNFSFSTYGPPQFGAPVLKNPNS